MEENLTDWYYISKEDGTAEWSSKMGLHYLMKIGVMEKLGCSSHGTGTIQLSYADRLKLITRSWYHLDSLGKTGTDG